MSWGCTAGEAVTIALTAVLAGRDGPRRGIRCARGVRGRYHPDRQPARLRELIVERLTTRGAVEPALLYRAPFTDYAPTGPDGLFTERQVTVLVVALRHVRATAEAS